MNKSLSITFFEDHFICTILPNESAWEVLKVNGEFKMLLYFYVSGREVRNDNFAKERYEADDTYAFGDFYNTILDKNKTFRKFDLELEPINLLKDVVEELKAVYAERIISFLPDFNINDEIPLNICFIPGISTESQELILNYFLTEGFSLNCKADYFESYMKILQRKGIIANKINLSIVESYFGDLLFHYIEYNDKITKKETEKLIGKGIDYRIGNLAKLIVEKAAQKSSSRLLNDVALLDQEIKKFHRRASVEINNFYYSELDIKIELSDFTSARIIIDQRDLEKMSVESFQYIKFRYESFISKHSNLARTEKILLNGDVLSSDAFTHFFEKTFGSSKVIKPATNFSELLSLGIFSNTPTFIVSEDIESISNLLLQIESEMANKKELEAELANLASELKKLRDKKKELLSEKEKLKSEIEALKTSDKKDDNMTSNPNNTNMDKPKLPEPEVKKSNVVPPKLPPLPPKK